MIVKYTGNFLKQLKKSNIRIRKAFKQRLLLFVKDTNDLELNNHPLQKDYAGYKSIDITAEYRAIYKEVIQKDDTYIYFAAFGTHNQLYG
ncbi:type II toxin-antitoxin system mRNA interferase toxin, RelE/StbE family [Patescibacteria group bacterium]|nr:type II toxin-antitoxin system mRNA interferase toxin, RelE/StbE family [Patescibacteria group bacterium]